MSQGKMRQRERKVTPHFLCLRAAAFRNGVFLHLGASTHLAKAASCPDPSALVLSGLPELLVVGMVDLSMQVVHSPHQATGCEKVEPFA